MLTPQSERPHQTLLVQIMLSVSVTVGAFFYSQAAESVRLTCHATLQVQVKLLCLLVYTKSQAIGANVTGRFITVQSSLFYSNSEMLY